MLVPSAAPRPRLHERQRYVYIGAVAGRTKKTSWDKLFEVAAAQAGLFTAAQAGTAGLYRQLLRRYVEHHRVTRVRRGIYRVVHFPAAEHEELAELWLWSKREGVFSHETALALHDLSDVLPRRVHLTVPVAWRQRRVKVPRGLVLHYAAVEPKERAWVGPVPVTNPERSLLDCVESHFAPDLLAQALEQAGSRGLIDPNRLAEFGRSTGLAEVRR
jgi:predicted transcriptional regulator of viral defense system